MRPNLQAQIMRQRDFYPVSLNGCKLYLPIWAYRQAVSGKILDISGNNNYGVITGAVPYPGNPQMTSVGSTFNRGDFTTTNAFLWSSLDLSPYAGTDLGSTPFWIELTDGAGKKATGYIGAVGAGAGETAPDELLNTPDFSAKGNWGDNGLGAISITGGKATWTACAADKSLYQLGVTPTGVGIVVRAKLTVDSITTGGLRFSLGGTFLAPYFVLSVGANAKYYTINTGGTGNFNIITGTNTTAIADDVSLRIVTDPPSTAVHIVSSLNGTTRGWANIESGFDPNGIASWKIYGVVPKMVQGWYFDDVDDLIVHPSINFGKTHSLLYWIQSFNNAKGVIHGGAANYHVAIDGTNVYYNAGATELSQAHGGGVSNFTMIGIVRSGTTVQFFKNGIQVGTDQTLDANNDQTLTTLGSYGTPGTFFGGTITEDEGFTKAFSAQEIRNYYELTRHKFRS